MEQYVADGRVGGVVALAVKDGEIVFEHAAGYRDIESGDSLEVDDLFRIASQSKAVTSVAAMILVEEGKLDFEDSLSEYIPEFAETPVIEETEDGYHHVLLERPITIRHLLTHTSGLSYGWGPAEVEFQEAGVFGWYLADKDQPIQEVVKEIARLPLTVQPGTGWVYGYSTDVLGAVVEIASGRPLDEFLEERIFEPLGMHDTFFFVPEAKADRLVTVYGLVSDTLRRSPDGSVMESQGDYVEGPRRCFSGGAGLVSTAQDYMRLQLMLLNGGELDGHRILSEESVAEMTKDQAGDLYDGNGDDFGLGFRIMTDDSQGPESPGTFGWGGAYHSHYWIDPHNGLAGIILTQLLPADGSDILTKVKARIYEVARIE
jgi:CubicO group peptidase (beta-lactamase class C family)